jgi:hypothetical protein
MPDGAPIDIANEVQSLFKNGHQIEPHQFFTVFEKEIRAKRLNNDMYNYMVKQRWPAV